MNTRRDYSDYSDEGMRFLINLFIEYEDKMKYGIDFSETVDEELRAFIYNSKEGEELIGLSYPSVN